MRYCIVPSEKYLQPVDFTTQNWNEAMVWIQRGGFSRAVRELFPKAKTCCNTSRVAGVPSLEIALNTIGALNQFYRYGGSLIRKIVGVVRSLKKDYNSIHRWYVEIEDPTAYIKGVIETDENETNQSIPLVDYVYVGSVIVVWQAMFWTTDDSTKFLVIPTTHIVKVFNDGVNYNFNDSASFDVNDLNSSAPWIEAQAFIATEHVDIFIANLVEEEILRKTKMVGSGHNQIGSSSMSFNGLQRFMCEDLQQLNSYCNGMCQGPQEIGFDSIKVELVVGVIKTFDVSYESVSDYHLYTGVLRDKKSEIQFQLDNADDYVTMNLEVGSALVIAWGNIVWVADTMYYLHCDAQKNLVEIFEQI